MIKERTIENKSKTALIISGRSEINSLAKYQTDAKINNTPTI